MRAVHVRLYGVPVAVVDACAPRPIPASVQPLLGLLAVEPHRLRHRDRVIDLLWPDVDPDKSRQRLNTAVWRLRAVLGEHGASAVRCTRSGHLALGDDVDADVTPVARLAAESDGDTGIDDERWRELVEMDDTEFVSGCYHDWVISTRVRLANAVNRLLDRRVQLLVGRGDAARALSCALVLVRREPHREDVHRLVIRLATQLGRYDEAGRYYDSCVVVLRSELAVQPSAETVLAGVEARRLGHGYCSRDGLGDVALGLLDDAVRHCRSAIDALDHAAQALDRA